MNKLVSTAASFATGMLAMYFFDAQSGRRRRAELRDRALAGARSAARRGRLEARHMVDQARGVMATGRFDRTTTAPPRDDFQLHERIRAELGRLVSHPGAVQVSVNEGRVTLAGHVLRHETSRLCDAVRAMVGVRSLENGLTEHEHAGHVPELQGTRSQHDQPASPHPAGTREERTAWH